MDDHHPSTPAHHEATTDGTAPPLAADEPWHALAAAVRGTPPSRVLRVRIRVLTDPQTAPAAAIS